jgi:choline dehydrogenase
MMRSGQGRGARSAPGKRDGTRTMQTHFDAEFDIVVAGGGSAGCIVASRVSENAAVSVCLIEAGPRDRHLWIHIPLGFGKLVPDPKVNWDYKTEPEPELNNRQVVWPRGKVLGGSGSINGLVFLRGAPSDYDEWERLGARGWGYREVLPYFKKSEHNVRGANEWRGQNGPITVSDIANPSWSARAFIEACTRLQYPRNLDFNGERIDGSGLIQLNVRNGWRCSTAVGYLRPNLARSNLELMTESRVRRVLLDGKRAIGVEVERDGKVLRIRARREVVVCAGAIASPQLLLASGIGPAEELQASGVTISHDLPGVGKDLQDHFLIRVAFRTTAPGTLNEIVRRPLQSAKMAAEWLFKGTGQLAVGAVEAVLFAKSRPGEPIPDIQFQCVNFSTDNYQNGLHTFPGFMYSFFVCRPRSRGEIKLRDAEGRLPPRIHANYLSDPEDRRVMLAGFRIVRQIRVTEPVRSLVAEEMKPGADCETDEQVLDYIRNNGSTVFHPCGTNRMGADRKAVVDPELKVHGLFGLRVIDASVMPTVPSSNIHPATIMLAEKGSDLLTRSLHS